MNTIYEKANGDFSNRAHIDAQRLLYPLIFNCTQNCLSFESTLLETSERNRILDGEMAIDRIVNVRTVADFKQPLSMTIQERFRRASYGIAYRDITITEWNYASGLPSELFKIKSGLFVYGYYDEEELRFTDAIAVSVPDLLLKIIKHEIRYTRRMNRKDQSFLAFDFCELDRCGVVRFRLVDNART